MGSIFDEPEEEDQGFDPMPHDPLHGPLSSGFNWEQNRPLSGQDVKSDEALDRPRGQFTPALPPTDEFLCCVVGPCRHYHEWLAEHDSVGAQLLTEVHRACVGFAGERVSLDEGTCFACTSYSPPWWSVSGLRRRIISAHRIGVARRRFAGRQKLTPFEHVFEQLYSVVKGDAPELPRPPR